jgi:hypothetical protein
MIRTVLVRHVACRAEPPAVCTTPEDFINTEALCGAHNYSPVKVVLERGEGVGLCVRASMWPDVVMSVIHTHMHVH